MGYLRLAILPGLLVTHLALLSAVVLASPTAPVGRVFLTSLDWLWIGTAFCTVLSQFFLTALWAGFGPEPWPLRITSCGALAVVIWIVSLVVVLLADKGQLQDAQLLELTLGPLLAWVILVGLLLGLRVTPWLQWRIAICNRPADTDLEDERSESLTRGVMVLVATCSGVGALLQDSLPWWVLDVTTPAQLHSLERTCVIAAATGIVLLPIAMLGIGLTLTPLADWLFYRRPWTLLLLVSVGLGGAAGVALSSSAGLPLTNWKPPTPIAGSDIAMVVLLLVLMLVAQPGTAMLVMGLSGYRLVTRKTKIVISTIDGKAQPANTDILSTLHSFKVKLCRAHLVAPVAVFAMIGALWPTGIMDRHMIQLRSNPSMNYSYFYRAPPYREFIVLNFRPHITDSTLNKVGSFVQLQGLHLNSTQVTDAGLVHLRELTNLQRLHLTDTQVTAAGLVHLKGLTNLLTLRLERTEVTDAGLVHLRELTNLQRLHLTDTQVTDAGLVHLKGLSNLLTLNLERTKVTNAGVAELQYALRNCSIAFTD